MWLFIFILGFITYSFRSSGLWLLKCCKNENQNVKMFLFNQNTFVFNKIYFHLYHFFPWYQNTFLFNQNKFVFNKVYFHYITFYNNIKIHFYSIKINLYSIRNILIIDLIFFYSSKMFFYYMSFSFNTFLVSTSGLPFVFTKIRIFISINKLSSCTRV